MEFQDEVPDELKDKVMTTITLAHLIGDFSELFTSNMGKTASKVVDIESDIKNKTAKSEN